MCSVAGHVDPAVWVFSSSGFHRFFATKPVRSETSKAARGRSVPTIVLSGLVAHSFFWLSERASFETSDPRPFRTNQMVHRWLAPNDHVLSCWFERTGLSLLKEAMKTAVEENPYR